MTTTTITATYNDVTALANVLEELIADGLPREKIYSDKDKKQIKVIVPSATVDGITEILKRHHPTQLT